MSGAWLRFRARRMFWLDTAFLLLAVKKEFDAVTAAQLAEVAQS